MRVLRDVGAEIPQEMDRFPSTIKKKGQLGLEWNDVIYSLDTDVQNTAVMVLSTVIRRTLPRLPRSLSTRLDAFVSYSSCALIILAPACILLPAHLA
jgi:hypothetical protein